MVVHFSANLYNCGMNTIIFCCMFNHHYLDDFGMINMPAIMQNTYKYSIHTFIPKRQSCVCISVDLSKPPQLGELLKMFKYPNRREQFAMAIFTSSDDFVMHSTPHQIVIKTNFSLFSSQQVRTVLHL